MIFCQFVEDFLNKACQKKGSSGTDLSMDMQQIDLDGQDQRKSHQERQVDESDNLDAKSSMRYDKLVMLLCLPQLMHGSFLTLLT